MSPLTAIFVKNDTSQTESIPKLLIAQPIGGLDHTQPTSKYHIKQMANSILHISNCQNGDCSISKRLFKKRLRKFKKNNQKKRTLGNKRGLIMMI